MVANNETIGFHKGALATLAKEREELVKMINVVEQIMQAHIKALKDLGIDLEAEAKKVQKQMQKQTKAKGKRKSLDDNFDRMP